MDSFVGGFGCELLEKKAFLGKAVGLLMKHPILALGAGGAGIGGGLAAYEGFKSGMSGEKPRYLAGSKYGPSDAFYTNYHEALPHELSPHARRAVSEHYNPATFGGKK